MCDLYVVKQGTCLRKEHGRFILNPPEDDGLEIPIREIERILLFGNIQLSTAVIGTCLQQQIPVVFLSRTGIYKGHLWSAELRDLEAERNQFLNYTDRTFHLETARAIIRGKLVNSRQLLLRLNRKRHLETVANAISGIQRDINASETAGSVDQLRGYEGITAARYFPALGQLLITPDFTFEERNRRPPRDPVNSLLSFGYTLLSNNVMSLILAEGLNPYLGNLHRSDKKLPELVLDLMEEFRSPVVDTLVVTLINRRTLHPDDFTWPTETGGVYIADAARRRFIHAFEANMNQSVKHPDVQEPVTYRRAIHYQVKRYKRALLEVIPYQPFVRAA
ncbi:CRISPR-associated endonuclease Cas1 [Halomicronema hongdechloris C2206]|uniref:CRISPR-associated endonuclease Cas1 n=1 Tax=Halomicronema hongdechloris C2206 TaxID=1641165 RepID=A0A1Z3HHU7_9CYAN|nr:CRISPR-associated endonuclease Cas1 [Halomicronema hongdechloris]ASC69874.1 CRISPR-associated endonuclease Cas1 [Halomicronema hongdechloris C2206]